jgi:hypothetical protein
MEKLKDIIQEYSTMRSLEVNKSRQEEANGNKDMANYHQGRADSLAMILLKLVKLNESKDV